MIRVLIHEWVTGGGLAGRPLPTSWAAEGRAMRRAIADDFARLDGVEVIATRDARYPGEPGPWRSVPVSEGEEPGALSRLATGVDFTLVIAPETGGVLADRLRLVERAGGRSLGSTPEAAALAGDKLTLAGHLRRFGIPTPPTALYEGGRPVPAGFRFPLVVKPRDGAGSVRTYHVDGPDDLSRLHDLGGGLVVQPFVEGEPLSATFLVGPLGALRLVAVGAQKIACYEQVITYEGGSLPVSPSDAAGPVAEAVRAVPGLRGLVGVDFVRHPATGGTTVIEINPRPTTSVVGLVGMLRPGAIARAWLGSVQGAGGPDDLRGMIPADAGPGVEFRPDGYVREGLRRC